MDHIAILEFVITRDLDHGPNCAPTVDQSHSTIRHLDKDQVGEGDGGVGQLDRRERVSACIPRESVFNSVRGKRRRLDPMDPVGLDTEDERLQGEFSRNDCGFLGDVILDPLLHSLLAPRISATVPNFLAKHRAVFLCDHPPLLLPPSPRGQPVQHTTVQIIEEDRGQVHVLKEDLQEQGKAHLLLYEHDSPPVLIDREGCWLGVHFPLQP
mmetsp:Transcript_54784/g.107176  ORF Transcript_54784/g.107176 Transcript_54784/m.107176 type:complete len:211 (+) Transcript_54784:355-987(+)